VILTATPRHATAGFTLIELAVSMFIIALLLGAVLVPLATQVEQRQVSETQKTLDDAKEALVGFALANGYLPCPDTTGDGIADPAAPIAACPNAEGFLPWVTLNVGQSDAWGNRLRYRISPEFSSAPSSPCTLLDGRLGLCKSGNITVNNRNTAKATQALASNVVAVILSHGKNGYGATGTDGTIRPTPPATNVDETTNADPPGTTFLSRTSSSGSVACSDTAAGQPYCEFDDIVAWISSYVLFNRMVAAGKLP
jgi:prepilin-type N-terminal cleavage/methylation domain-containing protein